MCCLDWILAPQYTDIPMQSAQIHDNCNIDHDLGHGFLKLLRVFYLWDFGQTGNLCDHQNNDCCDIYWILCYGQGTYFVDTVLAGKNSSYKREGLIDSISSFATW